MATLSTSSVFLSSSLLLFFLLCSSKEGYALEGRKITEGHLLQHTHITFEISSLLPASVCSSSPKGNKRASLKLIHRYGPCSQVGQDKANAPTAAQILSHDQSRVDSIQSRLSTKNGLQDSKATLPANSGRPLGTGNYFVTVRLGTPPKELSLVFDTGSDFTWTQCQPCLGSCYLQKQAIFDPSQSSTYSNITCNSAQCSQLRSSTSTSPRCSSGNTCIYGIQYGDQSFSVGYFAKEKLTLTSTDVINDFLFGCGQDNEGLFRGTAGLLGLGREQLSIVSQTSQKYGKYFSYCLPSSSSSSGFLTFGNSGVSSNVKFTPLLTKPESPSFYFIEIEAISVGGKTLSIDKSVFSTAGSIIDSGTVITRLPPNAYSALRTAFTQQMKKYPMAQPISLFDTCYDFTNYTTVSLPVISFSFSGGVNVDILSGILYIFNQSQACLAFAGNRDANTVAIFGNVQQQTLEVVYDVAGGKLGFGAGKCS
ncbi:hypothetical protein F0562_007514 [Nyssa sinensis]|uniref:Peptidase A1 domain-containing protein n=1 Tax=Nyssa sinensis TaxID=561372 RepID=A0A5J5A8B2_9ASTE|nr:hypothetical protein F0562_007514 [Nyssa sinensis]